MKLDNQYEIDNVILNTLFINAPIGIYILRSGRFVFVNPQFQRYTGYSKDELLEMDPTTLVHPEDREKVRSRAIEMLKGISDVPYEFRYITKNGEIRWSMETTTSIIYKRKRVTLGNFMDITERKEIQEQLVVTDRLASIGELSSGIAHEINNPLTGVIGFSDLLMSRDIPENIREDLQVINTEARRTASIVKNLLIFARGHPEEKQSANVNEVIQEVLNLRAYEQKVHNIVVDAEFADDIPDILADSLQLQQVFLNIVINAEYFMSKANGGGTFKVKTERNNGNIRATFSDDGPGISPNDISHLFDPFFTTKEIGEGTGLGLSICHGIIAKHEGKISVESKPGKGATFIVELPITEPEDISERNGDIL
jgi:PAS domain S-box-containing protein